MMRRYSILVVALAVGLGVVLLSGKLPLNAGGTSIPVLGDHARSITFSHKKHITEAGVTECATCHVAATASKLAVDNLAAGHVACATCHDEQVNDAEQKKCGYCHNDPQNIMSVPAAKREIIFSHEAHAAQGAECVTCHAGVENVDMVTAANMPSMASCNTCHNDRKATNTCEACHTNFATLIPVDHQRSDFSRNHRDVTRVGALNAECQSCHTETFCQQCHVNAELKSFSYGRKRDLMTEPSHKTSSNDTPKPMVLQNVHELNYRFTHGIDARAKQADCQSCHSVQTFCAQCHEAGGNITQLKFKPASHGVPGFTTLGRGSGGGLHAEEARRDMESCASCHDVEGKDPACMTCHLDNGKVR